MKRKDASAVQRAALDRIGREARMRSTGDRLPTSVRIEIGEVEPDEDDEEEDDDAPYR